MNTISAHAALALAAAAAIVTCAPEARAQRLVLAGAADVASGLEGGAYRGGVGLRRARTTLRIGVDAHVDEMLESGLAAGLLLEVEPHAAVGADVRYLRTVGERFAFDLGATGLFAPATLFGAVAGATYRFQIAPRWWLTAGPSVTGYFLGSDLPEKTVVWQALLRGGVRVGF